MYKERLVSMLSGAAIAAALAAASIVSGSAFAAPNGYGPDPDGDSNPAIDTRLFARIGDAAEAALDPPFRIITFEAPPGSSGDVIRTQYANNFGVTFSRGLTRQICDGPRYFQYDSQCTYLRAPSGQYAALYSDEFDRPLRIRFDAPVCAAALAVYPTGGEETERYKVILQPYADDDTKLHKVEYDFKWTRDTFRWRLMAGAYFLDQKARRVDISIKSRTNKNKVVRFLVDDVAFVKDGCEQVLDDIAAARIASAPGAE